MTAAPPRSQPMSDLVRRIRSRPNDAPIPTERLLDEAADEIAGLWEANHHYRDAVDVLEANARVQAKLLADTGRRVEELEGALHKSNDALSGWLAFAEEELGEFDLEECEFGDASEALCHKCQSAGCINLKIRNTRAALEVKP